MTVNMQNTEEGKDQESTQSSTLPDPEHHRGTLQKHTKNNTQEIQEVSHFQRGNRKAARNRQKHNRDNINMKHK